MGYDKCSAKTIPKSVFRRSLLSNCRSSFDKLFMSEAEFSSLGDEEQLKLKDRLMNNVKFIAYLFKHNLVSEQIISRIFESMLVKPEGEGEVSARTVEAAIVLITKIGPDLDKQLEQYAEACKKKREELKNAPTQDAKEKCQSFLETKDA